jgi:hypothetical protein
MTTAGEATARPLPELLKELEEGTLRRLDEIEASHRRLRWLLGRAPFLALIVVAAAGAALYTAMSAGTFGQGAKSIHAREFVLTDSEGNARGLWTMTEDGAARLVLQDRNGIPRLKLAVLEGGAPGVALTDDLGRSRIVLGLLPDETGNLVFVDQRGEARAVLGFSASNAARLIFADPTGVVRAGLGVAADGRANLTLDDEFAQSPSIGSN